MDNKLIHGVFRRVNKGRLDDFEKRPVDTKYLKTIAEASMVKRTNSRTKCMSCDVKPTVACHWANGHGMAWFCDKHFKEWLEEDDRDICGVWVLENGECPEDIRKNPKGTNKIRKLGDDISYEEIYQRIENKSYPAPHCGREGEQGGSAPRDECSAGGTTQSPSKLGGSIGSTKTPRSGLMSATFKNKKDLYKAALADGWKPDRKSKTPRFSKTTTIGDTTILSEAISLGYGDRGEVLRIVAQSTRTASSRIGEKAREMLKPREVEPPLDRTWYDEVTGGIRGQWTEEHATEWHAWMKGNTVEMTTKEALSEGIIDKDGNFMAYAMEPSTGIYLRNVDINTVKTMRMAFTNPSSRTGRRKHPKSLFQAPPQSVLRGGPGSGHHGHRGVRGQTGGSLPRSKGTYLGGLGVPDMKNASKRSFVSQRIVQVGGETVVALVSLRRLDVFKTKPYRLESRWYVKGRRGPATSEQQDAGTELLGELETSTVSMMEISGWSRSTYRTNLWVAPWGNVLIVPEKLTTRGGEGSGHFDHAGRPGEVGGSAPDKGGRKREKRGSKEPTEKKATKYCAECRAGGIYDEPAVAKIRHPNPDHKRAPPITKFVCDRHCSMLATDHGEELKILDDLLEEAPVVAPRDRKQRPIVVEPSFKYNIEFVVGDEIGKLGTDYEEAAMMWYDQIKKDIEKHGGSVEFIPPKLTTRGGEGSGHFSHAGRQGEAGGSEPGKGGGPTGGVGRPRHAAGVTPVSVGEETTGESVDGIGGQVEELPQEQELQMTTLQTYLDQPTQRSEDGIFGIAYTEDRWTDLATELMENQPPEIQEKMAEIEKRIREGSQSIEEHRDAETGEWTPERRALHERIIQGVMSEAGEAPEREEGETKQIWVTGGLPGAGKSTVLEYREAFPEGTVKIDSDKIKTMFPEYEGWNASLLHEESSAIVQEIFRRSTEEGRDIVYDATLKTTTKAEDLVAGLQDMGYGVNVIYVDVPMAMAMDRAINRFATQGGRYVSPMYIATHDSKNVKTLATLRDSVNSWEHWDNSQPKGGEPTLLATGGMEDGGR